MDDLRVYDDALKAYGIKQQIVVCMEECAELSKELSKVYRALESGDFFSTDNLAEEIADVQITIGQVEWYFRLKDAVKSNRKSKLRRLAERVKNNEKHKS